jgi:hypothetical protein
MRRDTIPFNIYLALGLVVLSSCSGTQETSGGGPGDSGLAKDYTNEDYDSSSSKSSDRDAADDGKTYSFKDDIKPYLSEHCVRCHQDTQPYVTDYDDVADNIDLFFEGTDLDYIPRHHKKEQLILEGLEGDEKEYPDDWDDREDFYKVWKIWVKQGAEE